MWTHVKYDFFSVCSLFSFIFCETIVWIRGSSPEWVVSLFVISIANANKIIFDTRFCGMSVICIDYIQILSGIVDIESNTITTIRTKSSSFKLYTFIFLVFIRFFFYLSFSTYFASINSNWIFCTKFLKKQKTNWQKFTMNSIEQTKIQAAFGESFTIDQIGRQNFYNYQRFESACLDWRAFVHRMRVNNNAIG